MGKFSQQRAEALAPIEALRRDLVKGTAWYAMSDTERRRVLVVVLDACAKSIARTFDSLEQAAQAPQTRQDDPL